MMVLMETCVYIATAGTEREATAGHAYGMTHYAPG